MSRINEPSITVHVVLMYDSWYFVSLENLLSWTMLDVTRVDLVIGIMLQGNSIFSVCSHKPVWIVTNATSCLISCHSSVVKCLYNVILSVTILLRLVLFSSTISFHWFLWPIYSRLWVQYKMNTFRWTDRLICIHSFKNGSLHFCSHIH